MRNKGQHGARWAVGGSTGTAFGGLVLRTCSRLTPVPALGSLL